MTWRDLPPPLPPLRKEQLWLFRQYLERTGWQIEPAFKNDRFQVLRARKDKRFLCIYKKDTPAYPYYTVRDPDIDVYEAYINERSSKGKHGDSPPRKAHRASEPSDKSLYALYENIEPVVLDLTSDDPIPF